MIHAESVENCSDDKAVLINSIKLQKDRLVLAEV